MEITVPENGQQAALAAPAEPTVTSDQPASDPSASAVAPATGKTPAATEVTVPENGQQAALAAPTEPAAPSDQPASDPSASAVGGAPAADPQTPATGKTPATAETTVPEKEQQVALATPSEPAITPLQPAPKPVAPALSGPPKVRVEAVEIEGSKVFVAGQASPGMVVRVYVNEDFLGETVGSAGGRFLIETERNMAVGDYIIRADLLDDGGRTVVARAAVPFQREEGEAIAAVAPPEAEVPAPKQPARSPQPAVNTSAAPAASSDMPKPASGVSEAANLEPAASNPPESAPELPAAPKVKSDAAVSAESSTNPSAGAPRGGAETEKVAAAELRPATPPDTGVASDAKGAEAPVQTQNSGEPSTLPARDMAAAVPADPQGPGAIEEITAPKLQSVQDGVIIRRGDTLWRISRRVYGRGVRYSTIYVANQDQIADPDRIWPGQVFRVPDRTLQGETADMDAMGEQVTTVEDAPAAVE